MKILAVAATLLTVMAMNVSALADGGSTFVEPAHYNGYSVDDAYSATLDAKDYSTVLITKASDDNDIVADDNEIVYIDQSENAFTGATTFLLKNNPDVGRYTVRLGSDNDSKTTYFYVGVNSDNPNDVYMNRLQNEEKNEDDTWNIGYYATVTPTQYNGFNSMKLGYKNNNNADSCVTFPLNYGDGSTVYNGEGSLYLIFQLNDVPAANKNCAAVFLSAESAVPVGGGN